jgi:hypothetical protein
MKRMALKAVVAATDLGQFEALISTEAVDREKDIVVAAAMVDALRAWTLTNKLIPLHWDHSSAPEDIVGCIDPASVKAQGGEVLAAGKVDLDTDRGRQVWRLMKGGVCGFRFGYLVPEGGAQKRACGGRRIVQLDVFEITVCPAPMNPATRVLWTKSAADDEPPPTPNSKPNSPAWASSPNPPTPSNRSGSTPPSSAQARTATTARKRTSRRPKTSCGAKPSNSASNPGSTASPPSRATSCSPCSTQPTSSPPPQARAEDGRADPSRDLRGRAGERAR